MCALRPDTSTARSQCIPPLDPTRSHGSVGAGWGRTKRICWTIAEADSQVAFFVYWRTLFYATVSAAATAINDGDTRFQPPIPSAACSIDDLGVQLYLSY